MMSLRAKKIIDVKEALWRIREDKLTECQYPAKMLRIDSKFTWVGGQKEILNINSFV